MGNLVLHEFELGLAHPVIEGLQQVRVLLLVYPREADLLGTHFRNVLSNTYQPCAQGSADRRHRA
ncbi:hypothetical protein D3C85_1365210 [compost metagenome]